MSPGKCAIALANPLSFENRFNASSVPRTAGRGKKSEQCKLFVSLAKHFFFLQTDQIQTRMLYVSVAESAFVPCEFADGKCVSFFSQIRPSDGGYGFTLEERNRVPIIKSVEKGSPAEVGK